MKSISSKAGAGDTGEMQWMGQISISSVRMTIGDRVGRLRVNRRAHLLFVVLLLYFALIEPAG